jgi:hypothetical protein
VTFSTQWNTNPVFAAIGTLSAYDPDLAAFITATGATNTESLGDLVTYLKAENLWTSSRIYPMKAAQNAGSGSIAYGLGGLSTGNVSLVSSPTWGASGIDFKAATPDGPNQARWFFGSLADSKYFGSLTSTGSLSNETYTTLQSIPGDNGRTGSSTASWAVNEDFTEVCKFGTFPSSAAVYKNKTAFVMDLTAGIQTFTPASIGYTANSDIYLSTLNNQQVTQTGKYTAWGVIGAAVTVTPNANRITDLINAL